MALKMSEELKEMFVKAGKDMKLTPEEKREIVKWYADDMAIIPKIGQDMFTFLFRQRIRQMRDVKHIIKEMHGDPAEAAAELHGDAKE
jgi:hypothetical protein